jgi:hypothetical protein
MIPPIENLNSLLYCIYIMSYSFNDIESKHIQNAILTLDKASNPYDWYYINDEAIRFNLNMISYIKSLGYEIKIEYYEDQRRFYSYLYMRRMNNKS